MELLEALKKANTEASRFYITQEQILDLTETPVATRNKRFSTHSDLIEVIDRRASLYKHVKFTQRSFDGDLVRGTVVPIKTSSKELPHQIKTSTKQIQSKLCKNIRNFGNLHRYSHRNYALKRIDINLAGVNRG